MVDSAFKFSVYNFLIFILHVSFLLCLLFYEIFFFSLLNRFLKVNKLLNSLTAKNNICFCIYLLSLKQN